MSPHQIKQLEVIKKLEEQVKTNALSASVVTPVEDFEKDERICLTSVHFPKEGLFQQIKEKIIDSLRSISPQHYYYGDNSLHITIKNIRIVNNPKHFTKEDIEKAKEIYSKVIPKFKKFNVYYYRLLLFSHNLALIGTTDEELDKIILTLDEELRTGGIPDDKQYINSEYFFSNVTLARFSEPVSDDFRKKVSEISKKLTIDPYTVDSVSLITGTAILKQLNVIKTWQLND